MHHQVRNVVACPAWMMGYIKANAGQTEGKWGIATIPGGSGDWGGSYVTVPSQGKHPKAAVELAKWLTAPEQNIKIFKTIGNFPSQRSTWSAPEVAGYASPFFNDARRPARSSRRRWPTRRCRRSARRAASSATPSPAR